MNNKNFEPLSKAGPIIKRRHVYALSSGPRTQLLSYDSESGLYILGEGPIRLAAQQTCEITVKEYHIREIVNAIARNAPKINPWDVNDPQERIVVFKNGVLDLLSDELEDHSSNWLYTLGIPHNYEPNTKCPQFERFMGAVLPSEAHQFVKQLLGYLLIPSTEFRKFVVLLGSGANGKSTLLQTIEAVLGTENVSHQSLHSLGENRFASFDLFGKLANIYADLEDHDVKKTGHLKQITSGDTINYERKFKDPFSAPVTARLVFSANKMPHISDESEAIADRLALVEFPNRFEEDQQDRELISKLTTEEEIEGILARWAVPGLKALLSKGRFDVPGRSQQLLQDYRGQCDPLLDFVNQELEVAPGEWIKKDDLYTRYMSWSHREIVQSLSRREFNCRISGHFKIPNEDRRIPGTRDRAWPNIRVKPSGGIPKSADRQAASSCAALGIQDGKTQLEAYCTSGDSPGEEGNNDR